jgi:hypothetical protein
VLVGVVLPVGYTLVVWLVSPGDLIGWFSELVSTVASVGAALFIGLDLFQHQTQEADRKKKEELEKLLKTELGERRRVMGRWRTVVPDAALETTENSFTSHEMQYFFHYTHPLIVEEAVSSGLFDTEQTSEMLALARNMRQHNVFVQEAITLERYEESALVASGGQFSRELLRARKRFARALRYVQESGESIINSCRKLLESLP